MGRIIRLILYLIRRIIPIVLRMVFFTFRSMILALVTVLIGLPRAIEFIASDWTKRAVDLGFPTRWETLLYWILCVVAFIQFLIGWYALSYLTVWVVFSIF